MQPGKRHSGIAKRLELREISVEVESGGGQQAGCGLIVDQQHLQAPHRWNCDHVAQRDTPASKVNMNWTARGGLSSHQKA